MIKFNVCGIWLPVKFTSSTGWSLSSMNSSKVFSLLSIRKNQQLIIFFHCLGLNEIHIFSRLKKISPRHYIFEIQFISGSYLYLLNLLKTQLLPVDSFVLLTMSFFISHQMYGLKWQSLYGFVDQTLSFSRLTNSVCW